MVHEQTTSTQRILVIEDNREMSENIASILQLAQYEVICAHNGRHGVSLAQETKPDLILCDIMMPELDGFGVLHILHQDPSTANIPFVFLTARADKNEVREGMNLGADDYLTKPFDATDLLKMIETRLKKSDSLKNHYNTSDFSYNTLFTDAKELKAIEKLLTSKAKRIFKKKEFVYVEAQTPTEIYFLQKGEVKTYKVNYDGKELITGIHGGKEFFGFAAVLEEQAHHENAEVMEEAEVITIPRTEFLQLVYTSKDLARKFMKIIAGKLADAEDRLIDLAYQSVRQRVAGVLLKLQALMKTLHNSGSINMCRKDLSSIVGTATESLNRTLADFKEEGLIEIREDGIKILNQQKLERLLH